MKNSQKGHRLASSVIISLLIIGGGIYLYTQRNDNLNTTIGTSLWKDFSIYPSSSSSFSIKYPPSWDISELKLPCQDTSAKALAIISPSRFGLPNHQAESLAYLVQFCISEKVIVTHQGFIKAPLLRQLQQQDKLFLDDKLKNTEEYLTAQKIIDSKNFSRAGDVVLQPQEDNQKMTYSWCMENGGKDTSPDYNAPKICTLGNRGYEEDCVNNDKYFVVSKNLTESVGSDILVKYKTSPTQNISCEYSKDDLDFEIKNERAEYIMSLENNFLILDSGTAPPPRGLIVYDLLKKKNVYNSSYSNPITIKNNKISYWTETSEKVTAENCSDLKEHESYGLGSAIETYITLDLNSLKTTDSGQHRCSPRQ